MVSEIHCKSLIAGIDTLEIGYCINEYKLCEEWDMLEEAKSMAQSMVYEKDLSDICFRGIEFMVNRRAGERCNYILSNEDIQVRILRDARGGKYFPELRIVLRSPFLWRSGWKEAVVKSDSWINSWADVARTVPSRLDIAADILGPLIRLTPELKEVVTRSRKKCIYGSMNLSCGRYLDGLNVTGYTFGAKEIMCRIYDKRLEIIESRKKWFEDLWREKGWFEGDPVTRVEFQCRRRVLRDLQVESISDLIIQMADIWSYLVKEWFTIRIIGKDTHRNRWAIHEFWKVVQSCIPLFGDMTGITRIKQMRPEYSRLESQARGLLVSMASMATKSLPGSRNEYGKKLVLSRIGELMSDPDFDIDMDRRKHRYSSFQLR